VIKNITNVIYCDLFFEKCPKIHIFALGMCNFRGIGFSDYSCGVFGRYWKYAQVYCVILWDSLQYLNAKKENSKWR